MNPVRGLAVAMLVALSAIACDTTDPTLTATTPTSPTNPTVENFTGSVAIGQSDFHNFSVLLNGGLLNITLTAAGPPPNVTVGLALGTVSGGICTPVSGGATQATAGTTPQLSGQVNASAYCVEVFDPGGAATPALTAPITYAVSVAHY